MLRFIGPFGIRVRRARLFVSLAAPKILRLGKNASELAFFSRLIRIFGCAEDTPPRKNASKLAFALAYSYFG